MTKQERREAWAQALESGEYTQAKGALRRGDSYCALGVGCDVFVKANPGKMPWQDSEGIWRIAGRGLTMPEVIARWFGVSRTRRQSISDSNDSGVPLAEITPLVRGK